MNHPRLKTQTITDLALAAFLLANGNNLIQTPPRDGGRKLTFVFEDTEKLQSDTLDFYNRRARVCPLSFSETFRNLKAMVF